MQSNFFDKTSGSYKLDGKFEEILEFEKDLRKFLDLAAWDTFLIDDFHEIISLVEEMVSRTPYAILGEQCYQLRDAHDDWLQDIRESA